MRNDVYVLIAILISPNSCILGYEMVRLQEDLQLAGFTPLMFEAPEPIYCFGEEEMENAQVCEGLGIPRSPNILINFFPFQNALRLQKLKFFGTNFLCNCKPNVLRKVQKLNGSTEFISAVQNRSDGGVSVVFIKLFELEGKARRMTEI